MGYTYYTAKGYRILLPILDQSHYDFVAEKQGEFIRVNVKLAKIEQHFKNGNTKYSIYSAGSRKRELVKADVLLSWLPDRGRFVEVPAEMMNGRSVLKIPQNLLTSKQT